jgi:general secretion pathway protein G
MRAKRGFTLVEILIVVVILGILAAIVVPQFTQASTEAKYNSLCSNLQSLRSQIELYKVQHNDNEPNQATFYDQMVYCTDVEGNTASPPSKERDYTADPPIKYGPYLERVPVNPFNDSNDVAAWGSATTSDGWEYNTADGQIRAADGGTTNGVSHQDL